jgi:hypothetical protein
LIVRQDFQQFLSENCSFAKDHTFSIRRWRNEYK